LSANFISQQQLLFDKIRVAHARREAPRLRLGSTSPELSRTAAEARCDQLKALRKVSGFSRWLIRSRRTPLLGSFARGPTELQALASAGPFECKRGGLRSHGGGLRTGASRAVSGGEDSMARAARAAATIAAFSRYR
jgi:hypothetical protein